MNEIILMPEVAASLSGNVEQLGAYLVQMAQMMHMMQKRLDEMEEQQKKITFSHEETKVITELIRIRAMDYCDRYRIGDDGSIRAVRNAIKKAVLRRYGVKDLHDVPAIARQAVEKQIDHWTDIRLVMKRREIAGGG